MIVFPEYFWILFNFFFGFRCQMLSNSLKRVSAKLFAKSYILEKFLLRPVSIPLIEQFLLFFVIFLRKFRRFSLGRFDCWLFFLSPVSSLEFFFFLLLFLFFLFLFLLDQLILILSPFSLFLIKLVQPLWIKELMIIATISKRFPAC